VKKNPVLHVGTYCSQPVALFNFIRREKLYPPEEQSSFTIWIDLSAGHIFS
jgi:hypothetical protein